VVRIFCVVAEVDLHPVDGAGEDAALCDLAEVLHDGSGPNDEAATAATQVLERNVRKNNLAITAETRDRLA